MTINDVALTSSIEEKLFCITLNSDLKFEEKTLQTFVTKQVRKFCQELQVTSRWINGDFSWKRLQDLSLVIAFESGCFTPDA